MKHITLKLNRNQAELLSGIIFQDILVEQEQIGDRATLNNITHNLHKEMKQAGWLGKGGE